MRPYRSEKLVDCLNSGKKIHGISKKKESSSSEPPRDRDIDLALERSLFTDDFG
jgi:hypothetical protein